ncbi:MAG: tRNA (guanine(10)-N(2))-dimethyltransferase [Hadesarchaea archaeon]|nr:tRNA (guanine(10)-N(2))-dimethyltransferase [Hadesarchaea archaeon]
MQTRIVVEGRTKLKVPEPEHFRTLAGDYAPSLARVFYNPYMEFCRDISVSAVQVVVQELGELRACDPLAGVGVRGIRYAKEVKGVLRSIVNDRSPEAFELIKHNIELNRVAGLAEARNSDANALLWENRGRFNFMDLDPFGSPAPFMDAACAALARRGMLAITATDTAPLSGTHARACLRRYGAKPLKTEYCHELGLRILVGFAQRVAGKHEIALEPALAHATQHYFRVYMRARRGAKGADEVLKKQGYVSHCNGCGRRVLSPGLVAELPGICECGGRFSHAGPLWLGALIDRTFAQRVAGDLVRRNFRLRYQELSLLNRCIEEAGGPATFYDLNEIARRAGVSPPKIGALIAELREMGHFASRTHFSNTGFRTNASLEELLRVARISQI